MDLRARRLLRKLVALLGSGNENERASAWRRIDEILKRHKRAWVELPELIDNIPDDDLNRRPRPITTEATSGRLISSKGCCGAMWS